MIIIVIFIYLALVSRVVDIRFPWWIAAARGRKHTCQLKAVRANTEGVLMYGSIWIYILIQTRR
jgi:hypothetical protein